MPDITVTMTATFDPRAHWYNLSMPSSAISYWASDLVADERGLTLREHPNERTPDVSLERTTTWQKVGEAIALMASGKFVDHDGTTQRLGNDYAVRACIDIIHSPGSADWDVEVDDLIFQMALLGKVVYG